MKKTIITLTLLSTTLFAEDVFYIRKRPTTNDVGVASNMVTTVLEKMSYSNTVISVQKFVQPKR